MHSYLSHVRTRPSDVEAQLTMILWSPVTDEHILLHILHEIHHTRRQKNLFKNNSIVEKGRTTI